YSERCAARRLAGWNRNNDMSQSGKKLSTPPRGSDCRPEDAIVGFICLCLCTHQPRAQGQSFSCFAARWAAISKARTAPGAHAFNGPEDGERPHSLAPNQAGSGMATVVVVVVARRCFRLT